MISLRPERKSDNYTIYRHLAMFEEVNLSPAQLYLIYDCAEVCGGGLPPTHTTRRLRTHAAELEATARPNS